VESCAELEKRVSARTSRGTCTTDPRTRFPAARRLTAHIGPAPHVASSAFLTSVAGWTTAASASSPLQPARSREVGVATEMLLTKAKQVSDDGGCAAWITP
jgi:hypothetical protein